MPSTYPPTIDLCASFTSSSSDNDDSSILNISEQKPPAKTIEKKCRTDDYSELDLENPMDVDLDESDEPPMKQPSQPNATDWIDSELSTFLSSLKPANPTGSVNEDEMRNALEVCFENHETFQNQYQLQQVVNRIGEMYGFTTRYSGYKILCACGLNSQQIKVASNGQNNKKRRKRNAMSHLNCPFFVSCSPVVRPVKDDNIKKAQREVKVTKVHLHHNHPLTKEMMIRAKKATFQYTLRPHVLREVLRMLESGPVLTKTLRNYLQKQYPSTVFISSTMVWNVRMRAQQLKQSYGGDPDSYPSDEIRRIFNPDSMEVAPEDWKTNPVFAKIYEDAMIETLSGDKEASTFPLVDILKKVKETQDSGYDYRIYYGKCKRPMGMIQMTPSQKYNYIRYGNLQSKDMRLFSQCAHT